MYRVKIKVDTHPLNTRTTKMVLAMIVVCVGIGVGVKLWRIIFPRPGMHEWDLPDRFDVDDFVPDRVPRDLLPDMYELSINATNTSFVGNVTITLFCRSKTTNLVLHAAGSLNISDVVVRVRAEPRRQ
ncbi:uncharacterized protein LOC144158067 [Haemaphysalis longicornis]